MSSSQSCLSHPKYRPDIDGLRAIAVLAVVAFHSFPNWIKGGFIGVDVFFVISGYLISTIIFENLDRGTFSFTEFYARPYVLSGNSGALLHRRPLRTQHATFTALGSSLSKGTLFRYPKTLWC